MSVTKTKQSLIRIDVESLTPYHWLVVGLAVLSGAIHLYLYTTEDYMPFLLAGLGFLGAVVLLVVLPNFRRYLSPVGILFVLAQIAGYFAIGTAFATPLWLDAIDKIAQVALVVILAWLTYREWGG